MKCTNYNIHVLAYLKYTLLKYKLYPMISDNGPVEDEEHVIIHSIHIYSTSIYMINLSAINKRIY